MSSRSYSLSGGGFGIASPESSWGTRRPHKQSPDEARKSLANPTQRIEGMPIYPDEPAFGALPAETSPIGDSSRRTHRDATDLLSADDDEALFDEDV